MRLLNGFLLCLAFVTGCGGRGEFIHYVVPGDFRGCFWVIEDPEAPPLDSVGAGWWQVQVPADRVVLAANLRVLESPKGETAVIGTTRTAAGLVSGDTHVAITTVGVWIGPRGRLESGRKYRSYFVGTEMEFVVCSPKDFVPPPRP